MNEFNIKFRYNLLPLLFLCLLELDRRAYIHFQAILAEHSTKKVQKGVPSSILENLSSETIFNEIP